MFNTEPAFDTEIKEDILHLLIMAHTCVFHFTVVLFQRDAKVYLRHLYCNVYEPEHVKANSQFLTLK